MGQHNDNAISCSTPYAQPASAFFVVAWCGTCVKHPGAFLGRGFAYYNTASCKTYMSLGHATWAVMVWEMEQINYNDEVAWLT